MADEERKGGFYAQPTSVFLAVLVALCSIAVVGIVCGFVARNPRCSSDSAPSTTVPTIRSTTVTVRTVTSPTTTSIQITDTTQQPNNNRTLPTIASLSTISFTSNSPIQQNIRLPDHTKPINYNLDMRVYFDVTTTNPNDQSNDRFEAQLNIDIEVSRATNEIVFHADYSLTILNPITITNTQTNQMITLREDQHGAGDFQLYRLRLDQQLPVGKYRLKLNYTGNYGPLTNIIGFYKTRYTEDGIIKQLVATKFQPTDARKAYPCFDEPALKASFEISLEHPARTIAISNWPVSSKTTLPDGRIRTEFEKTYPMSSYLAAWTVLPEDFGFKEAKSQNNKTIRVYARKNAVQAGLIDFALEMTKKAIDYFENVYFDPTLRAVTPKIDMIGFPDFPSGAMEHWGIVGYRETSLLYSDKDNSVASKQSVAFTISHEISHFWFGDLVTCAWWNDLWLNEAMARFLQFKAVQYIHPEWDVENQFLTLYEIPVMYDDGFKTSQPVSVEVNSPAEINSLFSSITYDKGSSLLRMLEATVGADNFREGLNNYLKKNEFSASVAADFYNSLKLPSDMAPYITPAEYMDKWLKMINYPIVSVEINNEATRTRVDVSQRRYVFPKKDQDADDGYIWPIYLKCTAGGNFPNSHLLGTKTPFTIFLNKKSDSIMLDRRYSWVKCNENFRGYYVNDYSSDQFDAFQTILMQDMDSFTIGDRTNLIHNAFSLSYSGIKSYALPIKMTNHFEEYEKEYVTWRAFTWHMAKVAALLEHRPAFVELKDFALFTVKPLLFRLNVWENSGSHTELLLKANIIDFICRMQDKNCLLNASNILATLDDNYFTNPTLPNNIPPYVRSIVYRYHVQNTYNRQDVSRFVSLYVNTIDPQEKSLALNAIAQTRMIWLLDDIFNDLLRPNSVIRAQDFFTLVIAVSRNPSGRHLAWFFIRKNWDAIAAKFGYSSRTMANAVKSICETFENEYLVEQMRIFFLTSEPGAGVSQRNQAFDIAQQNVWWVDNREQDLKENFYIPFIKKSL